MVARTPGVINLETKDRKDAINITFTRVGALAARILSVAITNIPIAEISLDFGESRAFPLWLLANESESKLTSKERKAGQNMRVWRAGKIGIASQPELAKHVSNRRCN